MCQQICYRTQINLEIIETESEEQSLKRLRDYNLNIDKIRNSIGVVATYLVNARIVTCYIVITF